MAPSPTRGETSATALALLATLAPLVLALERAVTVALAPESDPAAVVWATRSALRDRLVVTVFVCAVAAPGAVALARALTPRVLHRVLAALALAGVAATLLVAWRAP